MVLVGVGVSLSGCRRIVVKIGSTLLVDQQQNTVKQLWLNSLIADLVALKQRGCEVVVVSSGAVAMGCQLLQFDKKNLTIEKQQAAAAVGQIQLAHHYQALLQKAGLNAGQILLSLDDSENRKRYLNARNTLLTLLNTGVVPIVNENDTVATAEIRYGDNDRLAARVAQMVEADTLILLSDIDGFYTADPNVNKDAQLLTDVNELSDDILAMAKQSHSNLGSGGMITKLAAAKIAMNSGCKLLITAGKHLYPISHFIDHGIGTWFHAYQSPIKAKKAWLNHHLQPKGQLIIDQGASIALGQGKSLLSVGILGVKGRFVKGDAVNVETVDGAIIARGLTNYANEEVVKIKGSVSTEIAALLGYDGMHEVIHCDNLSLLSD